MLHDVEVYRNANPAYTVGALVAQYERERQSGRRPLTSISKTQREAVAAGVRLYKALLLRWDDLTDVEALWELRKGEESVFYPLFKDDPTIWADCPRCRRRVVINDQGICPECTYEF